MKALKKAMIKELVLITLLIIFVCENDGKRAKNEGKGNNSQNLGKKNCREKRFCKEQGDFTFREDLSLCLHQNYTTSISPNNPRIEMKFDSVNIIKIDPKKQAITTSFKYFIQWNDDRIVQIDCDPKTVVATSKMDTFWIPKLDIYQLISAESHPVLGPKEKLVLNDGKMKYSAVKKFETACAMHFEDFPFDQQICSVEVCMIIIELSSVSNILGISLV